MSTSSIPGFARWLRIGLSAGACILSANAIPTPLFLPEADLPQLLAPALRTDDQQTEGGLPQGATQFLEPISPSGGLDSPSLIKPADGILFLRSLESIMNPAPEDMPEQSDTGESSEIIPDSADPSLDY